MSSDVTSDCSGIKRQRYKIVISPYGIVAVSEIAVAFERSSFENYFLYRRLVAEKLMQTSQKAMRATRWRTVNIWSKDPVYRCLPATKPYGGTSVLDVANPSGDTAYFGR